jgi:hypothetical protein
MIRKFVEHTVASPKIETIPLSSISPPQYKHRSCEQQSQLTSRSTLTSLLIRQYSDIVRHFFLLIDLATDMCIELYTTFQCDHEHRKVEHYMPCDYYRHNNIISVFHLQYQGNRKLCKQPQKWQSHMLEDTFCTDCTTRKSEGPLADLTPELRKSQDRIKQKHKSSLKENPQSVHSQNLKGRKAGYRVPYGSDMVTCDGNLGTGSEPCKEGC